MNKLFTSIAVASLSLTMAVGVGVAVNASSKNAIKASASQTYTLGTIPTKGWTTSGGSQTMNGVTWTYDSTTSISGANNKIQIGSSKNPQTTAWTISTPISSFGSSVTITSVTLSAYTTAASATYDISVGGSSVKSGSLTTSSADYTPSGTLSASSGNIVFTLTGSSSSKAMYITGISVTYDSANTLNAITDVSGTITAVVGDNEWTISNASAIGTIGSSANQDVTEYVDFSVSTAIPSTAGSTTVSLTATKKAGIDGSATSYSKDVSATVSANPFADFTLVTNISSVSVTKVYALSNDGNRNFAGASVNSSKAIPLVSTLNETGYYVLEETTGGYHLRFATGSGTTWSFGNYINNSSSTDLASSSTASSVWTLSSDSTGVYLTNSSNSGRHLGDNNSGAIKAYASGNIGTNKPMYLYQAGLLPTIECAVIELNGMPSDDMCIGETATLTYTAYDSELNPWTGDVVFSISNESTSGVVELSSTTGPSVTLTAKKAGTATVSVQDEAGNADPDSVTVTVLADPTRIDLPAGTYPVMLDYTGVKKDDPVPENIDYEIKDKEGSGSSRVWYKNMTVSYTGIQAKYAGEYTWTTASTSVMEITNRSNAKVTAIEISYYDTKRFTVKDASDNTISEASASANIVTYSLNSDSFSLTANTNTTSAYYVKIIFTVQDSSETFLSLVASLGQSYKTDYKEGHAPTNSGVTVVANYTRDGTTISRSEDVTSLVSTWTYNPSVLSVGDTSFTVQATWDSHQSNVLTVSGITVSAISGPIANGRYYIMNSDKTFGLNAVESTSKPLVTDLSTSNNLTAFDVKLTDDNAYEITTTIEGVKYYLVCNTNATSGSNEMIRIISNPSGNLKSLSWVLSDVTQEGAYHVSENTTGEVNRYLSCYNEADWRGYVSTSYGDPEIQFVAEKYYAEQVADKILESCSTGGESEYDTTAWGEAKALYNAITISGEKDFLKNGHADKTSSDKIERALEKYDYAVARYHLTGADAFITDRVPGTLVPNSNLFTMDSETTTAIIVVVALTSVTAIGAIFFIKRRKYN